MITYGYTDNYILTYVINKALASNQNVWEGGKMATTVSSKELMEEMGISRRRLEEYIAAGCPMEPRRPNTNLRFPRAEFYKWYEQYTKRS